MKIHNRTRFVPFSFQSLDRDGDPVQVVVVKGTFDIVPSAPLAPSAEQDPLCTADEHHAGAASACLRREDDLAPFKPFSDIVVNATAHAPQGKPAASWIAGVSVGMLQKRVRVTGPRVWAHAPLVGWGLGEPRPVTEVPIRYDHAFGGAVSRNGTLEVFQHNPIGRGFADRSWLDPSKPVVAPSVLTADGREPVLGEPYPVEGFSPIPKAWLPRRALAGTFDAAWLAERHPYPPRDFDPGYHNSAHPDLVYDGYLRGGEAVSLQNLHPRHEVLAFSLPRLTVAAAVTDEDGYRSGGVCALDTLIIEPDGMKVVLVWRIAVPLLEDRIERVDVVCHEGPPAALVEAVARSAARLRQKEGRP